MVDSIRPIYRRTPVKVGRGQVHKTDASKDSEQTLAHRYSGNRDRRRQGDRRKGRVQHRDIYDMRNGRGRRKEDGAPSLNTEA